MIHHTFIFNDLPAHELVPYLVAQSKHWHNRQTNQNRANNSPQPWHVCWLNNDNNPVIGLLPRTSWIVNPTQSGDLAAAQSNNAPALNIEIIKSCRQEPNPHFDCYVSSYSEWIQELIEYSDAHSKGAELKETLSDIESSQYHNGIMGFIGYDIGAKALSPSSDIELANQPAAFMGHYDIYLTHSSEGWQLHAQDDTPPQALEEAQLFLQHIDSILAKADQTVDSCATSVPPFVLEANWQFADYAAAFEQTQQFLYQGDSYQINLTQKWSGRLNSADSRTHADSERMSLVSYLPMLHEQTKAPFAGYLVVNDTSCSGSNSDEGDAESTPPMFELLSCSPELFVVFSKDESGSQKILTKPIKGTLPRGTTPEQDEQLKQQLANSDKDRAENVMIVDLLRNDLGRYAKTGSVQVPHLFAIESFSNVHHMVSSITATINDDIHPLTVLFDSLPAGSITGTPKKRAVEIISELESGPRGAYCGTLGFMNFDGLGGQWNVLIRSLQANQNGKVELWAGGGITVSSECAAEYQECKDKVGNLLRILSQTTTS